MGQFRDQKSATGQDDAATDGGDSARRKSASVRHVGGRVRAVTGLFYDVSWSADHQDRHGGGEMIDVYFSI